MKPYLMLCTAVLLYAQAHANEQHTGRGTPLPPAKIQNGDYSPDEQPAKTVMDFLKWYRDNAAAIGTNLVYHNGNENHDPAKYYAVNFDATEKYLATLKSTGAVSEKYVKKWRAYFLKCDAGFKEHPSNEGPPQGFDYDLVMLSQDYDEDLQHIEKAKIIYRSVTAGNAIITIRFLNGDQLSYKLTKHTDRWLIDDIERTPDK